MINFGMAECQHHWVCDYIDPEHPPKTPGEVDATCKHCLATATFKTSMTMHDYEGQNVWRGRKQKQMDGYGGYSYRDSVTDEYGSGDADAYGD